jgi:DNA-3-methyladenine glycosylase I
METQKRCLWCGTDPLYVAYHDTEWGRPEHDSRRLWECLVLEGFQAGLNWITILRKRESFRAAFAGFDPEIIAQWGEPEVLRLLADTGIIRHRGKIEATISGARAYLRIEAQQGFSKYLWDQVNGVTPTDHLQNMGQPPNQTPASVAMSKSLKSEGFKFCGPTITYAFMQAVGMVNDHVVSCDWHRRMKANDG